MCRQQNWQDMLGDAGGVGTGGVGAGGVGAGRCGCWGVWVLGGVGAGRCGCWGCGCWEVWVLGGVGAGRCGCWEVWVLGGVGAGRCGCWEVWVLGGVGARRCGGVDADGVGAGRCGGVDAGGVGAGRCGCWEQSVHGEVVCSLIYLKPLTCWKELNPCWLVCNGRCSEKGVEMLQAGTVQLRVLCFPFLSCHDISISLSLSFSLVCCVDMCGAAWLTY